VADSSLMSSRQPELQRRHYTMNPRRQFGGRLVLAAKDRSAMNLLTVISAGPSKFVSVLCERGDGIEA